MVLRWVRMRVVVDRLGDVDRRVCVRRVVWAVRWWRGARWVGVRAEFGGRERRWVVQFVRRVV